MANDPGGVQVLRFEPRATLDSALVRHNLGKDGRPNHSTQRLPLRWDDDQEQLEKAKARLSELTRKKKRGQQPHQVVDLLIAGPPPFHSPDAWDDSKLKEWAVANRMWLEAKFPHAHLAVAAVHMDETSPHMHVLLIPECSDRKLSWSQCQREAVGGASRNFYRSLQDDYQHEVGRKFELDRGEIGSDRKHQPIDLNETIRQRAELAIAERKAELDQREVELDAKAEAVEVEKMEVKKLSARLKELRELEASWSRQLRDWWKSSKVKWKALQSGLMNKFGDELVWATQKLPMINTLRTLKNLSPMTFSDSTKSIALSLGVETSQPAPSSSPVSSNTPSRQASTTSTTRPPKPLIRSSTAETTTNQVQHERHKPPPDQLPLNVLTNRPTEPDFDLETAQNTDKYTVNRQLSDDPPSEKLPDFTKELAELMERQWDRNLAVETLMERHPDWILTRGGGEAKYVSFKSPNHSPSRARWSEVEALAHKIGDELDPEHQKGFER